jgi:hypothetical protein
MAMPRFTACFCSATYGEAGSGCPSDVGAAFPTLPSMNLTAVSGANTISAGTLNLTNREGLERQETPYNKAVEAANPGFPPAFWMD